MVSQLISSFIGLSERGYIPDFLIRFGHLGAAAGSVSFAAEPELANTSWFQGCLVRPRRAGPAPRPVFY